METPSLTLTGSDPQLRVNGLKSKIREDFSGEELATPSIFSQDSKSIDHHS